MEHARDQRDERTEDGRPLAWPGGRAGTDRRATDRRQLHAVAPRSPEDRRQNDRRQRDRRVKIAGAGLLAGLAFTVGAREFASMARHEPTAPLASDSAPPPGAPSGDQPAVAGEEPGPRTWDRASLEPFIQEAAALHGLPADLIRAVIQTESRFNTLAESRVGAQGLMQLMPTTARHMGIENPFDPRENILGGTKYLSTLLDRFKGNTARALAAYNAGPTVVARHRGIPPYRETRNYVQKIHKLVEDTDAEFALPPAPKVTRVSLRARGRHGAVSRRARARHAAVHRSTSRRTAKRTAVHRSRRTR